jgi:hypothetical protein
MDLAWYDSEPGDDYEICVQGSGSIIQLIFAKR